MAAAEEKNLMREEKELQQPEERRDAATVAPPTEPGRQQLFNLVVDTFLAKMEEAGSYQSFASCYSRLYKAQPELTKCIYDQFICRLTTSFREEVQELKQEGNLEVLFGTLDELEEGAKERHTPAWRPSGIPEEDLRSALLPYVLKQHAFLQKTLKEKEEENARLAETVLAGRKRISELQEEIKKRKAEWQAIALEGRELVDVLITTEGETIDLHLKDVDEMLEEFMRMKTLTMREKYWNVLPEVELIQINFAELRE